VLFTLEYRRGFQGFLFVAARKKYAKLSVLPMRLLVVTYFLYMAYLQYKAEHCQYLYIVHMLTYFVRSDNVHCVQKNHTVLI
jgi:hypothetical protein